MKRKEKEAEIAANENDPNRYWHNYDDLLDRTVPWSRGALAADYERNAVWAPHLHKISRSDLSRTTGGGGT